MNEGIIVNRYAKALFQASDEEGRTDSVKNDIDAILLSANESEEFANFLVSPIIKESVKEKILLEIFEGKVENITLTFLKLITKNKREQYLRSICHQYLYLYKEKQGIKEAVITTSLPLDKEHREEIDQYIKKKFKINVELIEKVDPSIVGGFILRLEDQQIDASIASKLSKIRTELINS